MNLRFNNSYDFSSHNERYNKTIANFINNVFQTETVGLAGYVKGGEYSNEDRFSFTPVYKEDELNAGRVKSALEIEVLEFEKVLNYIISEGDSTLYTLIGAMGSGKTSSIEYTIKNLKESNKNILYVYVNFNPGYSQDNIDGAFYEFLSNLLDKLKAKLHKIINDFFPEILTSFEDAIKDDYESHYYFYDFREQVLSRDWEGLVDEKKVSKIYSYIKGKSVGSIEMELRGIMHFLFLIKHEYSLNNEILMFACYDNVDKFPPALQLKILKFILNTQRESKVTCLLPLRRSTFTKFRNRAALSFQNINQVGPKPVEVVIKIIEKVIEDFDKHFADNGFSKHIGSCLKDRLTDVYKHLSSDTRTKILFSHLSGKSIKIGLRLARNLFVTNYVRYDEPPENQNAQYGRSLLLPSRIEGYRSDGLINTQGRDSIIINLFSSVNRNTINLLKVRVLQLLDNFVEYPESRRVCKIIDILEHSIECSKDEIIIVLNSLLFDERPLIGGEHRAYYENQEEVVQVNDILRLTELGKGYLKLLGDARYVQEMLFQLEHEDIKKATYDDTIQDRFRALRHYLYIVNDLDVFETNRFAEWSRDNNFFDIFIPSPISSYIIYHLSYAYIGIATTRNTRTGEEEIKRSFYEGFEQWSNLIFAAKKSDPDNERLTKIYERFRRLLYDMKNK